MTSKFVRSALSIAALSPLLFSSLAPANAQASTAQIQKTGTHISMQEHPKNVNATKSMHSTTADPKSTKLISYSPQTAPILRLGSRGKAVREIQAFLKTQKLYNEASDGVYGRNIRSAVIAFQKSHNLKADGVVGAKTWSEIIH
jgi:peptidoglycan hydrolase-like protein with peptidoglycan-binding domain